MSESIKILNEHNMTQLSLDGPNTNWSILKILEEDELPVLEDQDSCGLHSVSGAFTD